MDKKITLGIDLGTTYSAVAYVDEHGDAKIIQNTNGNRITPSVVFFEEEDNIIVGQNAKDEMELSPESVVSFVKREMGKSKDDVRKEENFGEPKPYDFFGKRYTPEEISSLILIKLKNAAETEFQGQEITDVVITVPAYFDDSEKKATKDAGKMAGFNVLQVINEPTAAAIAYGVSKAGETAQKVFVFDLGGGTFDVTILDIVLNNGAKEINIIQSDGDHRLGGKDWDDKIIEYVAEEFINQFGDDPRDDIDAMANLREKSEKVKKSLSDKNKNKLLVNYNGNKINVEITKDKFEEITTDLMSRIEGLCDSVLSLSKLNWSDIDTVLLVGGSTRMPMVQNLLKRISGKEIRTDLVNPDECVAKGAAILSTIIPIPIPDPDNGNNPVEKKLTQAQMDNIGHIKVNDATNHTFGIVTLGSDGKDVVSQMITKGTTTPFKFTDMFETNAENQTNIFLQIKEGESANPDNVKTIQEATFPIVNPLPAGSPIEITFDLAADGMLTVIGKDITNNKEIIVKVETTGPSDSEIESSKNHLKSIDVS
ncbi:Hsp70 family protein [bacterium AH-315-P13]|nr:Hsp70 family protein [bacterium AH-315-P13]